MNSHGVFVLQLHCNLKQKNIFASNLKESDILSVIQWSFGTFKSWLLNIYWSFLLLKQKCQVILKVNARKLENADGKFLDVQTIFCQ
jgi:hypothetical protein